MGKNILMWSMDRKKYDEMLRSIRNSNNFKEIIGHVFDTTWELTVRLSFFSCTGKTPFWTFCFKNNQSNYSSVAVAIKIIFKKSVISYDLTYTYEKSDFIFEREASEFADNNLEIFFIFKSSTTPYKNLAKEFHIVKLQNLSNSLQDMLEKEHMTDVALKCDSVTLKAHKSIFSIQSPVFEAMFTSPMVENKLDTVVIEDIDPCVLRAMVSFMYSGKVKEEFESFIYDLLYAAEKYQIEALKEGCIEYLKNTLSYENAIKVLEVSDVFDQQLKSHCLDYIKSDFKNVKSTKEWKDLKQENTVLALEVYSFCESD